MSQTVLKMRFRVNKDKHVSCKNISKKDLIKVNVLYKTKSAL